MMDFDLQKQLIAQRMRQYGAQADYQNPQGQMVGNRYVAPNALQYIAAGLRSVGGMRGQQLAEEDYKSLSEQQRTATADALRKFGEQAQGAPAEVMPEGVQGPARPAVAPNMRGAYSELMAAPDAQLRQLGAQGMARIPEIEARRQEAEIARQARTEQLAMAHQQRMDALQAQNASREQQAQAQRDFQREMQLMRSSATSQQPYYQPVQTGQGVFAFNARTGKVEPVTGPGGAPIVGAAADPALQGQIAGAKTGATTLAKAETERSMEAPQVVTQGEESIRLVDELLKSPGFKQAVGASRMFGIQNIPGTAAKDFDVRLDQLKGKQFLQAFEGLKGGGQITEVEGRKATDAISRMNASSSEEEFTKAAREFQDVIRQGVSRARKAQTGAPQPAPTAPKRMRFDAQGNPL